MDADAITKVYVGALVISMALPVGVVMFAAVGYFVVSSGSLKPVGPPLGTPLLSAAAAVGLLAIFSAERIVNTVQARTEIRSSADAIRRFGMTTIVPQAVKEGVGLFGIVLGVLTGSTTWILVFAGGAVVSMLVAMPKREDLEALARHLDSEAE